MSGDNKKFCCHISESRQETIYQSMPIEEETQDLADFFKIFGDSTRIRILFLLKNGEFCVHDISTFINMQQTAVSHQLKLLRNARLVKYRKEGKQVFYSLNDGHIEDILATGLDHLNE